MGIGFQNGPRQVAQQQQDLEDMKKVLWQRRAKSLWAAAAVMFLGLADASAQLAITEVMSAAAVTLVEGQVVQNSDWWELTNFGTNAIDLTDYYWTESSGTPQLSFHGLVIDPGKSVIVFRNDKTPDETAFCEWWTNCLGANLQGFRSWGSQGLDAAGEFVRLYDSQSNLVDSADFGPAFTGTTFVSDPETGEFGVYSTLGQCGTCQTTNTGDIGSPGTACGPVPLSILVQPTNVLACPGLDAVFSVKARGLPRPRYQWLLNSNSIPGATSNPLVIPDAQSTDEGEYQVVVSNGLEMVLSAKVTLTLNTNPSPPQLLRELSDVEVFQREDAQFSVLACAVPRPQFQWAANGVDIDNETNRTLVIAGATLELSGTLYSVRIWNTYGSTNASARLVVHPTPTLAITEAMPAPSNSYDTNCPAGNWWELTNLGTTAVQLQGCLHFDGPLLSGAKVVTNNVVIQPDESVVFAEGLTREQFIRWWGATNLPPDLQVITYHGYGLSRYGDSPHVWSAAGNRLVAVSYRSPTQSPHEPPLCPCYLGDPPNPMCGHPMYGHSLFFDTNAVNGQCSEENENGAFRAEAFNDVGSPGFFVLPRFFGFNRNGSALTLRWRAVKGNSYQVEWRPDVEAGDWATDGVIHTAQGSTLETTDTLPEGTTRRFYRLRELP